MTMMDELQEFVDGGREAVLWKDRYKEQVSCNMQQETIINWQADKIEALELHIRQQLQTIVALTEAVNAAQELQEVASRVVLGVGDEWIAS